MTTKQGINDVIAGILFLIVSILFFIWSLQEYRANIGIVGPNLFPSVITLVMILFSIVLIIKGVIRTIKTVRRDKLLTLSISVSKLGILNIAFVIFLILFYLLVVDVLGYILTSFIIITLLSKRLGATLKESLIVGLIGSIGTYVLFGLLLKVALPGGIISW